MVPVYPQQPHVAKVAWMMPNGGAVPQGFQAVSINDPTITSDTKIVRFDDAKYAELTNDYEEPLYNEMRYEEPEYSGVAYGDVADTKSYKPEAEIYYEEVSYKPYKTKKSRSKRRRRKSKKSKKYYKVKASSKSKYDTYNSYEPVEDEYVKNDDYKAKRKTSKYSNVGNHESKHDEHVLRHKEHFDAMKLKGKV